MNFASYLLGKPYTPPAGVLRPHVMNFANRGIGATHKNSDKTLSEKRMERILDLVKSGFDTTQKIAEAIGLNPTGTRTLIYRLSDEGKLRLVRIGLKKFRIEAR